MGNPGPRHERSALAAGGRVATIAPESGVLPAQQPDSKGHKKNPMGTAECTAATWSARPLANRQEPLFVSVGAVVVACRGKSRHPTTTAPTETNSTLPAYARPEVAQSKANVG